ncbi:MAG: 2-oxoacid:acceptor oxidoreductase family protein [Candidatus Desulforudaceae bacterium]|jgi:2-oxoglutarate ferredoxin oxidoreductase subunit gamma
MIEQVLIAGFGGQGILSTGQLLAYAGMMEGKHVAWIPAYGPEMRGGTANCGVTVSDTEISSPLVTEPNALMVMNQPSLAKFENAVLAGGIIITNSSLVELPPKRSDLGYLPPTPSRRNWVTCASRRMWRWVLSSDTAER